MSWQLVNHEGRLAITLGWSHYNETPIETRDLWVHPTEKWHKTYEQFTQISLIQNNHFHCWSSLTYELHPLSTEGWEFTTEERPIPPPGRGGKDWKWVWSPWSHKYIKEYT